MNDSDFLEAVEANPCDPTPRLVYADWLDDQGDPRGELLRIQEELRHIDVPNRPAKEARMHELLNDGVEPLIISRTITLGIDMVLIFPGEFVMGSPREEMGRSDNEGQIAVTVPAFWIGKCSVTQAAWQQIMGSRPWDGEESVQNDPRCPATCVSWNDAIDFCRELTLRERAKGDEYTIPTESQWEYACRSGTTTRFSFGDPLLQLGSYCWFDENTYGVGEEYAHQVGLKKPNPWGLADMHGNVWEACKDWYQQNPSDETDPRETNDDLLRVYRGGCWGDYLWECRSACRRCYGPTERNSGAGFRLAQTLPNQQ